MPSLLITTRYFHGSRRCTWSDCRPGSRQRMMSCTPPERYSAICIPTPVDPLRVFFPNQPLEQTHIYDPRRKVWRGLLFGLRKAKSARREDRLLITFKDDMQHSEVSAALSHLPQTVKHQLKGKTVIIESPAEFE